MRKISFSLICFLNLVTGFGQEPSPKEIVKNKITKMIMYNENNMWGEPKTDTSVFTFDTHGYVVYKDEGVLGIFENRYTYNKDGNPLQCIEFNGYKYKMDSIYYTYNSDGSYTRYKYSYNDLPWPTAPTTEIRLYNTKGFVIKAITPVPDFGGQGRHDTIFYSWKYDSKGGNISTTEFTSSHLTPKVTNYTIKYDANGRISEVTWPSKYSTTELNKERYTYNKMGLVSKYSKVEPGKEKLYIRKDIYTYQ